MLTIVLMAFIAGIEALHNMLNEEMRLENLLHEVRLIITITITISVT